MKLATVASLVGLGLMMAAGSAQAQYPYSPTLGRITRGEAAPLGKSMTQGQARRACQQEMRGARESRASIRTKMSICVRKRMEGI